FLSPARRGGGGLVFFKRPPGGVRSRPTARFRKKGGFSRHSSCGGGEPLRRARHDPAVRIMRCALAEPRSGRQRTQPGEPARCGFPSNSFSTDLSETCRQAVRRGSIARAGSRRVSARAHWSRCAGPDAKAFGRELPVAFGAV